MSNSANQLGGKCPYMPYLGRGQMSGGEHVLGSAIEIFFVISWSHDKDGCYTNVW